MDNFKVYIHINKLNGYGYVGMTKTPVRERWGKNGNGYSSQYFGRIIDEVGWENFEHIVLNEGLTEEEAKEKEQYYVSKYRTYIGFDDCKGYNCTPGGDYNTNTLDISGDKNPMAKKVYYDGKIYGSLEALACELQVSRGIISKWIKGTCAIPKEHYDKGLCFVGEEPNYVLKKNEHMNGGKSKKVICDNIIYDCINDCAKEYDIKANTMTKWLNGNNSMPPKFYELGLRYLSDVDYDIHEYKPYHNVIKVYCIELDMLFDSLSDCVKYIKYSYDIDIKYDDISRAISKKTYRVKMFHFLSYKDYISMNDNDILNSIIYILKTHNNYTPVICLNNNICFLSISKALYWCNIKSGIYENIQHMRNFAGKDPITGDRLQWKYLHQYLEENNCTLDDYRNIFTKIIKKGGL